MNSRKQFLSRSLQGAAALSIAPGLNAAVAQEEKDYPTRFIFMTKCNGLRPADLVPTSFDESLNDLEKKKSPMDVDLSKHALPKWMSQLEKHKKDMSIVQGLSAKGMACGHHAYQSCLGMYRAKGDLSSLLWATADVELSRLYPSPFGHIEMLTDAGKRGIVSGRAALGPMQANYAYADPSTAFNELFKTVSKSRSAQQSIEAESLVLKSLAQVEKGLADQRHGLEKLKVGNYANSVQALRNRNEHLKDIGDVISNHIPKLDKKLLASDATITERHDAYAEIICSALISGLSHVALFSLDTLHCSYNGIPNLERDDVVGLHDIGHGGSYFGHKAETLREFIRVHHMKLMDRMATRLKEIPEGDGTMFDRTVIMYQAENGETHHSRGTEQPIVILAGQKSKMNMRSQYVRLPPYGVEGHKTLGNWYTTLLNNHGNSIQHYGQIDLGLKRMGISQKGPISSFLV